MADIRSTHRQSGARWQRSGDEMQLIDQDVPGPKRDFVGYGRHVPRVLWPNNAKVALNIVVNYEEGSEYSKPAGDNRNEDLGEIAYFIGQEYRDLSVESTY